MRMPKAAASCRRRAAEVETQAAQITDEHLKTVYLRIARQLSGLARSYEFADSAKRFLLDAKRTKERECATAQKRIGPLTVVALEWRSQALPAARSGHAGRAATTPVADLRAPRRRV
jgi:hypothetical protein